MKIKTRSQYNPEWNKMQYNKLQKGDIIDIIDNIEK